MRRSLPDGTSLHTLPNGLRVIFSPRPGADSSALVLVVGSGSKNETLKTSGLTHFLEHMVFQGTKSYPKQAALDRALANIGADFNATTDIETTSFTFLVPNDGLTEALQIMGDVVCHPLLKSEDVTKEREVVIQELKNDQDDPKDIVEVNFANLMFPDHGLGRPIIGTAAGLRGFTATDLKKLHKTAYTAPNMILSIVSNAPESEVLEAVSQAFKEIGQGESLTPVPAPELSNGSERVREKVFAGAQTYLMVGARGPSWHAQDRPAADLVANALGGSLYARLPLLLRATLGEVYSVESSLSSFVETGVFSTYTDCAPAQAEKVLKQILDVHSELLAKPFTQEEIDLARSVVTGDSVIALDDGETRAEFFADQLLLHGVFYEPKATYAQWSKVTADDANRAVRQHLSPRSLSYVCLSPEQTNLGHLLVS